MQQYLGLVALLVRDYDEAIAFYVGTLGFLLAEDIYQSEQDKRWVVLSFPRMPSAAQPNINTCGLLLARATDAHQASRVGDQTGGRVFLFLYTDDFWRDFNAYKAKGVKFIREPKVDVYGTVAVFEDIYGNKWDLIQAAGA